MVSGGALVSGGATEPIMLGFLLERGVEIVVLGNALRQKKSQIALALVIRSYTPSPRRSEG